MSIGSRLGHYEVLSVLGKGGMGEVYLANDTHLDRPVALKILPIGFASEGDRLPRFIREAKAASALNHPNIVTVYDIGNASGTHFIAYEFVDGRTLREHAGQAPLTVTASLDIAMQIVSALVEAHQAGIVHRDLKPDNVMVRPSGLVKLLDFGIARLTRRTATDDVAAAQAETQAGVLIGTPRFMSPEQARGLPVDHQTDIFSFGVVFHEMLTGVSPFAGDTIGDVIAAVLTREPPRLTNVPRRVADIISTALQKEKSRRYQTAAALLRDLADAKQDLDRVGAHAPVQRDALAATQLLPADTPGVGRSTSGIRAGKSVAVLPFVNMSADEDNEHFCDGLAEELLNALSRIDALKVAARTSAFSFKGKSTDVATIARALGVSSVLEGSVRRSGNRLRISVQLIDAADGYQVWSERYDREMRDIFELQDELTLAVVDALKVTWLAEERAAALKRYTDNAEAYELYLKGLFQSYKYTAQGWQRAIEFFERAIAIAPDYALAYAGIAKARGCQWFFGIRSAAESLPEWRFANDRAQAIDDGLSDAYLSRALISFFHDWEWSRAEQEFAQAIALNPLNAEALSYQALFLVFSGRVDEAVVLNRKALKLDPLAPLINMNCGWSYFAAGMLAEASQRAARMVETDPEFYGAYWLQGAIDLSAGEFARAVEQLQRAVSLGAHQIVVAELASACSLAGRDEEAAILTRRLEEVRRDAYVPAICLARVYSRTGQTEKAVEWLETAFAERNGELVFLREEIAGAAEGDALRRLADEPRVTALFETMNLP